MKNICLNKHKNNKIIYNIKTLIIPILKQYNQVYDNEHIFYINNKNIILYIHNNNIVLNIYPIVDILKIYDLNYILETIKNILYINNIAINTDFSYWQAKFNMYDKQNTTYNIHQ